MPKIANPSLITRRAVRRNPPSGGQFFPRPAGGATVSDAPESVKK
jgi:hypothetical protein